MSNTTKKKKQDFEKLIIPFVVVSIFTFTGLAMYVQIISGIELSASLITCFFAFCTGELWMLASIKKTKIKNNFVDDPTTPEDESEIYAEIYQQGYDDAMQELSKKFMNNFNYFNNSNEVDIEDEGGNGVG